MTDRDQLSRQFREGQPLHTLIDLRGPVTPNVFMTKRSALLAVLSVRGSDPEGVRPEKLDAIAAAIKTAFREFSEEVTVKTYRLKRSRPPQVAFTCRDPLAAEAIRARQAYLSSIAAELYSHDSFITVTLRRRPTTKGCKRLLRALLRNAAKVLGCELRLDKQMADVEGALASELASLNRATERFITHTADTLGARLLSVDEAFSFFRRLLNPDPVKASTVSLSRDTLTDYDLVSSELEFHRDHIRNDNYCYKTLTLKRMPATTRAGICSVLDKVKGDIILVTEWTAISSQGARKLISSKRRFAHNTKFLPTNYLGGRRYESELLPNSAKEAAVADSNRAAAALELEGVTFGEFSLTFVVLGRSLEEAERVSADLMKVIGRFDGALNEERYNGACAFLATTPAAHEYNLRKLIVTDQNHADLAPLFHPATGDSWNRHLGSRYLVEFETEDQALYFFNLHVGDVAHALLIGPTGGGKSFFLNFLLTHLQQYEPRTFIFDAGRSFRALTDMAGGNTVTLRPEERSCQLNPFALDPTPGNLGMLYQFVQTLLLKAGCELGESERREVFEAIKNLYLLPPALRRLGTLATTLPSRVGTYLRRWTAGEQYGAWFDNEVDTLSLSTWQLFDLEGLERLGEVLEPLLLLLLHRVDQVVSDEALSTVFKIAVFDEGHLLFQSPVIRGYVENAMRTWRKKNAAVIISTQSLQDLGDSKSAQPLIDNCPTKLLFPNRDLDAEYYAEVLQLNDVEIQMLRTLTPKKQVLLNRNGSSKVLNLNTDKRSYWLYTTNPYETKRRQELVARLGLSAALDVLAGEAK